MLPGLIETYSEPNSVGLSIVTQVPAVMRGAYSSWIASLSSTRSPTTSVPRSWSSPIAPRTKKSPRPKAETPKGFRDYFGPDIAERNAMLGKIAEVYHLYGFDALESSAVETLDALGKYLPDVERPHAGVFAWQEDDGEKPGDWLALRYDMTAPLARVAAQFRNDLPTPYRRYTMGPVWRNEKPGPGRFRQFYQCDADIVGSDSLSYEAELIQIYDEVFSKLGLDVSIKLNNRKILAGIAEAAARLNAEPIQTWK